jgi:hypothetical protein
MIRPFLLSVKNAAVKTPEFNSPDEVSHTDKKA